MDGWVRYNATVGGQQVVREINVLDLARCGELLALEPPRYCPDCRRRMKVQATPLGWQAECSRHGVLVP